MDHLNHFTTISNTHAPANRPVRDDIDRLKWPVLASARLAPCVAIISSLYDGGIVPEMNLLLSLITQEPGI